MLVMRLTTVILIASLMQVSAATFGQRITLNKTNVFLSNVLKDIRKQSGFDFYYDDKTIPESQKINISVANVTLDEALKIAFKGLNLKYDIEGTIVTISKNEVSSFDNAMARFHKITVKGKIIDESGKPLGGATILTKGGVKTTLTDVRGEFEIPGLEEESVLVISYIGYKSLTIKLMNGAFRMVSSENGGSKLISGTATALIIQLAMSTSALEEMVVVGYGITKKKDLTGSISSIQQEIIEKSSETTIDNVLMGRIAGVNVIKSDGAPGSTSKVQIRGAASLMGSNEPLYVIDGVPMPQLTAMSVAGGGGLKNPLTDQLQISGAFTRGLNGLSNINLDDVAKIDILKDASATAIYGARGANGVVQITTKKGNYNQKAQFDVSLRRSYKTAFRPDVLNAKEFEIFMKRAIADENNPSWIENQHIWSNDFFKNNNTYWVDKVVRTGVISDANISVRGGGISNRYYASLGVNDEAGTIINSGFKQYTGSLNLDVDITDYLRVGFNTNLGYAKTRLDADLFNQAVAGRPDYPVYDENGKYYDFNKVWENNKNYYNNPLAYSDISNVNNNYSANIFGWAELTLFKNLRLKTVGRVNYQNSQSDSFRPSYIFVNYINYAEKAKTNNESKNWLVENTLTYNKIFNNVHNVALLLGQSAENNRSDQFSLSAQNFPNDTDGAIFQKSRSTTRYPSEGIQENGLFSYFGRATYNYNDRYYLTATLRRDGSSRFSDAYKYGYFPSAAVAWRLSGEPFMQNSKIVNDLKLRTSYGVTGNNDIGNYRWQALAGVGSYGPLSTIVPSQLGNDRVKWETSKSSDIGLDYSLFNNRLFGSLEYYYKKTDGALIEKALPTSSGYPTIIANAARVDNYGFEIEIGGVILEKRDWKVIGNINFSRNRSVIKDIAGDMFSQVNRKNLISDYDISVIKVGESIGTFWGYEVEGIIRTQEQLDALNAHAREKGLYSYRNSDFVGVGDFIFKDFNDDGMIDSKDRTVIGHAMPDLYGGFNFGAQWKGLSLSAFFNYSVGADRYWRGLQQTLTVDDFKNRTTDVYSAWTPSNPNSNVARISFNDQQQNFRSNSDFFIKDGSYLKLKDIILEYKLSVNALKKIGINSCRIYASATNLWTLTNYPGLDPEVNSSYGVGLIGNMRMGEDSNTYPQASVFSAGIRLNM